MELEIYSEAFYPEEVYEGIKNWTVNFRGRFEDSNVTHLQVSGFELDNPTIGSKYNFVFSDEGTLHIYNFCGTYYKAYKHKFSSSMNQFYVGKASLEKTENGGAFCWYYWHTALHYLGQICLRLEQNEQKLKERKRELDDIR